MNNEELMQNVEKETRVFDEHENKIQRLGIGLAIAFSLLLAIIMVSIEFYVFHKVDYGKPALLIFMAMISDLYEGIKLKRTRKFIFAAISLLLFVVCLVMYIGGLRG